MIVSIVERWNNVLELIQQNVEDWLDEESPGLRHAAERTFSVLR